jgi:glycosyltransferase involved in cell wall biosynthesis
MRILYVISDFTYCGASKQLVLLAAGLPPERFERRVCALGAAGPWAEHLRNAGIVVDVLGWRRKIDLPAFRRLRHILRAYQADVVHVWDRFALRAVALAGGLRRSRLVVTASWRQGQPSARVAWWDRRLLRHGESITVSGQSQAAKWEQQGLGSVRLAIIPPGVEIPAAPVTPTGSTTLPSMTILCVGRLERHKGFRDAVWVLDMLRFLHPQTQLTIVGDGPDRHAIEDFAGAARVADQVRFLGERADVPALLAEAELVWAPCRAPSNTNVVLEAMAAGKPVIASEFTELAEIIIHGQTGLLVPPGDQAALARQTRLLLDDPKLRQRMGEAARRRAAEQFGVADMIRRFAELYKAGH